MPRIQSCKLLISGAPPKISKFCILRAAVA
jgi:hypothetical protein